MGSAIWGSVRSMDGGTPWAAIGWAAEGNHGVVLGIGKGTVWFLSGLSGNPEKLSLGVGGSPAKAHRPLKAAVGGTRTRSVPPAALAKQGHPPSWNTPLPSIAIRPGKEFLFTDVQTT
jgi:hypothetical protein